MQPTVVITPWVHPEVIDGRPATIHPALLALPEKTLFTPHLG